MTRQGKIFYGWWVVIALFLVEMFAPMTRYSMTAFLPFISSELGWSRSLIGLAQSLACWIHALFVLLTGWMTDRVGGQKTIFLGGFLALCGWILFSTTKSLWQLYLYYGVIMAIAMSLSHLVPLQATGRKWFTKRAGLVAGIITSALGVGLAIFMPLLTAMSGSIGWRTTSVICAFAFGISVMLLALFIIRDTPESIGLHPDGEGSTPVLNGKETVQEEFWTTREAVKTPQLWLLFVTYSAFLIPVCGLLAHLVVWGVDLGSPVAGAGIFMTAMTAPSIVAKVGGGWLGDRYGKRQVIIISNIFCLLVMLWAWLGIQTAQHLIIFAALVGIGYGAGFGLYPPYIGDLFGRAHVGSLFGILTVGAGLIGGSGALIWGTIFDTSGSYQLTCLVGVGCYLVATIAALLIRPVAAKVQLIK